MRNQAFRMRNICLTRMHDPQKLASTVTPMNIRPAILFLAFIVISTGIALAATYTYKCPRCGLIQQYDRPGIYKCPSDGTYMISK